MVMRKTIGNARAKLRPMALLFGEKFWFEFPGISIHEWDSISRNLRTQEQPREVCPNFQKFQVLPGILELNSVFFRIFPGNFVYHDLSPFLNSKVEWQTLLVLQIPNCGHLFKITIL